MNVRVILVEDSSSVRKLLCEALRSRGFPVYEAWSVTSARQILPSVQPKIMLLDLELDGDDGYVLLEEAVAADIAVVVISARDGAGERVRCLTMGAADYIVKPVDIEELVLRMRRAEKLQAAAQSLAPIIEFESFSADLVNRSIVPRNGPSQELSPAEFRLLRMLLVSRGRTITREEIAREVLGKTCVLEGRSVDVLVSKLRRKLDPEGRNPVIWSVRGQGYRLAEPRGLPRAPAETATGR